MQHSPPPPLLDIIQSATEPIITIDSTQRIVMFNPAAEKVFLYTAEQAIGASVDILIPPAFARSTRNTSYVLSAPAIRSARWEPACHSGD